MKKIIDASELRQGDLVLEIGPGTGVLTEALVEAGAEVIGVEADLRLVDALREKFGESIELFEGDIFKVRALDELPLRNNKYKLVANIPYNITSEVIQHFLTKDPKPSRMVLMVQKEVADRIVAKPPKMSLLSVVCQLYADCKKVANVPKGAFRPIPKVDSAIVRFDLKRQPSTLSPEKGVNVEGWVDPERVIKLAKVGFSSKRKQLHKNLANAGITSSQNVKKALDNLGLDSRSRAEVLTVKNWVELAKVFHF